MSDLELLFLVLTLLYGWECACWLRRGAVAFRTWLNRGWKLAWPGALLGNQRGGFILASPLPPLGTLLTAAPFPLSLSPDAAFAWVPTNPTPGSRPFQSACLAKFDSLRDVRGRGSKLIVNGQWWLTLSSANAAHRVARELTRLAGLKPGERERAIRDLIRAGFDDVTARRRWEEFRRHSRSVRIAANVLFVYLFLAVPSVIWAVGLKLSWPALLAGLVAATVTTAVLFRRAHHALYPEAGDERFTQTLTIALSPPTAIRACDTLSRPLLESFHPLTIARIVLPEAVFRREAGRVLRDLRHPAPPMCPSADPLAVAAEAFGRAALVGAAEEFLKRNGIDPGTLCRPPVPAEESSRAYCPRCEAQFTRADACCGDCGGLKVLAFPQ